MLPKTLIKGFDKGRLQKLLALIVLALAVPTSVLIWQAYGQLKWEAFHQHRGIAEALTRRIDTRLNAMIRTADARSFADYAFLVVSGDPSANFVQRSPLSAYPVAEDLPGVLGYFQIDAEGTFSTPLLPPDGTQAVSLGISDDEYNDRLQLAQDILTVLADNQLVRSRSDIRVRRGIDRLSASPELDYDQQIFDQLNEPGIGKVSAIKLDAALQKKSEEVEREVVMRQLAESDFARAPGRSKRRENIALPESVPVASSEPITNITGPSELRISTFESEIDPFEFSLLDSGHFVLFRKVWRDGERYIQGLLLDREVFTQDIIGARFVNTALANMSNLIVAYQNDVIQTYSGRDNTGYNSVAEGMDGALLYRNRLTAPLNSLELIFSINRLPAGAGASVLGWVTLVLAIVFVGGFAVLYRLGLSQINLARQQQDFVSAVSHELKTPLTSIRMYGEMLKEGWADEEKRQSYYNFIHDEAERLSRLISNVLQLARMTRNEPQYELQPTTVGELMGNIESKIASQIESAGYELHFKRAANVDGVIINIDADYFAQIIINLVDNAIKFSRNADQKVIEVSSKRGADSRIQFSVRDFGPGIPKDQMKKIFQLFYRSESELTRETVGTGIGLAIVHQLTIAMHGSVDMVNVEPGAEFRIMFSIQETT